MPAAFQWLTPFLSFYGLRRLSLRRLNACGVSMADAVYRYAVSMASPFECLRRLTSLRASPFYVLRTFQWLRRFYGFAVSMPAAFNADAVSAVVSWRAAT